MGNTPNCERQELAMPNSDQGHGNRGHGGWSCPLVTASIRQLRAWRLALSNGDWVRFRKTQTVTLGAADSLHCWVVGFLDCLIVRLWIACNPTIRQSDNPTIRQSGKSTIGGLPRSMSPIPGAPRVACSERTVCSRDAHGAGTKAHLCVPGRSSRIPAAGWQK